MRNYALCLLCVFLVSLTMQAVNVLAAGREGTDSAALQQAAEQGNADAQAKLGEMYFHGQGVPKDHAKAVQWYQKAAV
jgi:hypothetical protein